MANKTNKNTANNMATQAAEKPTEVMLVDATSVDVIDFTAEDESILGQCKRTIETCQKLHDGLASKVAQMLFIVSKRELYKIDGYSGIGAWAENEYGLAKSTVSEAIKVYERFGTQKGIAAKYSDFAYSTLIQIKGLTDEEIEFCAITPDMTRSKVKDVVKELKSMNNLIESMDDGETKDALESAKTLEEAKTIRAEQFKKSQKEEAEKRASGESDDSGIDVDDVAKAMDEAREQEKAENAESSTDEQKNVSCETISFSSFEDENAFMEEVILFAGRVADGVLEGFTVTK